ncbi:alcohol dehydrogenase [Sulfolobales archaeon HS-7]|nr:alcohol dehydrogenase [Sulfolobales archaeon HS-7]
MKAIVVTSKEVGARIKEINDAENYGEVKIRALYNGVCGTDREIVNGRRIGITMPPGKQETVLGHEALGVVEEGNDYFKKGDLVMPVNRRPCNKDINCLAGRPDFCETGEFVETGIVGADGFMREFWLDSPRFLIKVPHELEDIAILAQPLADIEKSVEEILNVQRRLIWTCNDGTLDCRKVLILGTGPIGTLFSLVLKSYQFDVWFVNRRELNTEEQTVVDTAGLNFFNSSRGYDELISKVEGFDLIIDTTGAEAEILNPTFRMLKRNGVLGLFGFPHTGIVSMHANDVQNFVLNANVIVGLVNGQKPHYQQALLHLAAWKTIWPKITSSLITRTVRIEDPDSVLNVLSKKEPGEIKVRIEWK